MTESVWWYVLAGFLLGFILSTLWEWAYFRRRRLRIENRRIAELEASLRALTTANGAAAGLISPAAAEYQGPGAYLETEQSGVEPVVETVTTIQETQVAQPEQPSPMQPVRRAAAVAGYKTSTQRTYAQSTYVPPASSQTTNKIQTSDTTLVIDQPTPERPPIAEPVATVIVETPPEAERSTTVVVEPPPAPENVTTVVVETPPEAESIATVVIEPPERETVVAERGTMVVIQEPEQPQQAGFLQQDTAPTTRQVASALVTAPATAPATAPKPATLPYESRNGHDHPNRFVRAAASAAALVGAATKAYRSEAAAQEADASIKEPAASTSAQADGIEGSTVELPLTEEDAAETGVEAPEVAEPLVSEVETANLETRTAAAAVAGVAAVLAAEHAQGELAPADRTEQPVQPADNLPPPALHSFLPAAARAMEANNNGSSQQTTSTLRSVEPAGIQSGIQRVEHDMDNLCASLKELAETTSPLLSSAPASAEARTVGNSRSAPVPEGAVSGPYAARNLSRTEYAVVRLMQSARQVGRELRSLFSGE